MHSTLLFLVIIIKMTTKEINHSYNQKNNLISDNIGIMNIKITKRAQSIKASPTLAVSAQAAAMRAAGRNVISLSAGEPDFPAPEAAKKALIDSVKDNQTHYTQVDGIPSLKEAVIEKFKQDNQLDYKPEQILVSVGAKQSLFNLALAVLEEGDEAIIPAPYWVSYPDIVKVAQATPSYVLATREHNFKITPAQLEEAINPNTRLLFFNSPSNPTGKCYDKTELEELAEVLKKHPQVLIASDDIYEHTLWEKTFYNLLNVCPELYDRTIVINGVSKCYAMTGLRIGYAAGPVSIIKEMKKLQSQSTSNPTSTSQYAAEAALRGDQTQLGVMIEAFHRRHDLMFEALSAIDGIDCLPADGTFYLFPEVTGLISRVAEVKDDLELASYILEKAEVAMVAGTAFGAPGYIRLSYATSEENLKEAANRLQRLFA